jgi:hypothetical protein
MAGRKLSARAEEEVIFLEGMLTSLDHLSAKTEEYWSATRGDADIIQAIVRQLSSMRQNAMMKNLGPIADNAGILSVAANRGSKMQRCRVLREGLVSYKQAIERTIKASIDADQRHAAEDEREREKARAAAHAAAQRIAERALREGQVEGKQVATGGAPAAAPAAPQAKPAAAPAKPVPPAVPTPPKQG